MPGRWRGCRRICWSSCAGCVRRTPSCGRRSRCSRPRRIFRSGGGPGREEVYALIEALRDRHPVAGLCRRLDRLGVPVSRRSFWRWVAGPEPSARALWDTTITEVLAGYYKPGQRGRRPPESMYGAFVAPGEDSDRVLPGR